MKESDQWSNKTDQNTVYTKMNNVGPGKALWGTIMKAILFDSHRTQGLLQNLRQDKSNRDNFIKTFLKVDKWRILSILFLTAYYIEREGLFLHEENLREFPVLFFFKEKEFLTISEGPIQKIYRDGASVRKIWFSPGIYQFLHGATWPAPDSRLPSRLVL